MLKTFFALLGVLLAPLSATAAERDVQLLVIVADQSNSMGVNHWLAPQRDALVEYFSNFEPKCNTLVVVYLGWGGDVNVVRKAIIHTRQDAFAFASQLVTPAVEMNGSTNQKLAIENAAQIIITYSAPRAMIFTTDEFAFSNSAMGLSQFVPPLTSVYGIALGNNSVEAYVRKEIVPSTETTYQVKSPEYLRKTFFNVLNSVIVNSCIG